MAKNNIVYFLCLLFVMVLWGLNMVAIKILVEVFPPFTMTATRILVAALVIGLFLYFRKGLKKPTKSEWLHVVLAGITGVLGHHLFITIGLLHTTASNAAIILALAPLTTSLIAAIFLNEKLTVMKLIGIWLGIFGVSLVVLQGQFNFFHISIGDMYVFMAMLAQTVSYIFIKKGTASIDTKEFTAAMFFVGAVSLLLVSNFIEPGGIVQLKAGDIGLKYWIIFLASAIFATGVGHLMYNSSIRKIGASRTAIFLNMAPLFSLIGSAIFLKETITLIQICGFLLITSGVICGVAETLKNSTGDLEQVAVKFDKTK